MKAEPTQQLVDLFKEISDELWMRGERPVSILHQHVRSKLVRAHDGRMAVKKSEVER